MTDEERESRKAELERQKCSVEGVRNHYQDILDKLQNYQNELNTEDTNMNTDFDYARNYNLIGNDDWYGVQEGYAKDHVASISAYFDSYNDEIYALKQQIDQAILNICNIIDQKDQEIANLQSQIDSL